MMASSHLELSNWKSGISSFTITWLVNCNFICKRTASCVVTTSLSYYVDTSHIIGEHYVQNLGYSVSPLPVPLNVTAC